MKAVRAILGLTGAVVTGLSIGWMLRAERADGEKSHDRSLLQESVPTSAVAAPSDGSSVPGLASDLTSQLEMNLAMSTGVTRWLYWMEAIEKASLAEFPRLARMGRNDPLILPMIGQRWVTLDPKHMFETLGRLSLEGGDNSYYHLSNVLFFEWVWRDQEAVIAALDEGAGSTLWNGRSAVVERIMRRDPERGLALLSRWNINDYSPGTKGVAEWAAKDPRRAIEVTLAQRNLYFAAEVSKIIGSEWAKQDPQAALKYAAQVRGAVGDAFASGAMGEWAKRDLAEVAEWLGEQEASTRNRLSPAMLEIWATTEPAEALNWCGENLSGPAQSKAVAGIIGAASEKDIAAAAKLVSAIPPSSARSEGAATVASKWLPTMFGERREVQPESLEWLASLDRSSIARVLERSQWEWSGADPRSMADFILRVGEVPVDKHVYSSVARELARRDPGAAIEWSAKLPGEAGLEAGGMAFTEWRTAQPEFADTWFMQLTPTDSRFKAILKTLVRNLASGTGGAARLAGLPEPMRVAARELVGEISFYPGLRAEQVAEALR